MSSIFPAELQSPRLYLQPVDVIHARPLFESVFADAEVMTYLTTPPMLELGEAHAMVERCRAMTDERVFAISLRAADPAQAIGTLSLRRFAPGRVDLGYALSRAFWGQGLMTEAVRAVIDWSLAQGDIWRVAGVCDIDNAASAKTLAKAGMSLEGILRRWGRHPNVSDAPRDCYSYSIVREDAA